jgi:cellulose synthase/poly-beta-1,6-N-acetylglucosamine synthase-like glycosyltransferase
LKQPPSASVVVCTRNRAESLARCLGALRRLDYPRYEVLVVDNSPGDDNVRRLANDANARWIVEERVGLSRARNTGARAAGGDVVAFIDDDAVARSDWLTVHVEALRDPSVAATAGRIVSSSPRECSGQTWAAAVEDLGDTPLRVDRTSPHWFEQANFGGIGSGSNMAFRAGLFQDGWGFRESLGLGEREQPLGEEHYAFFALISTGHAVAYLPSAVVYHEPPTSPLELRLKKRRLVRGSASYAVMLFVEHPDFRAQMLRYALTALRRERRSWRRGGFEGRFLSRRELAAAGALAPLLYWRSRRTDQSAR